MKPAVLFDLGNTLVAYYRMDQFGPILERAVTNVADELRRRRLPVVPLEDAFTAAQLENAESPDLRITALKERLERIFGLSLGEDRALEQRMCRAFLEPIFALARVHDDSLETLEQIRAAGHPTAIVSNAPWGSPPELWHAEIERLGLAACVDAIVMCTDVGWRKPARASRASRSSPI